MNNCNNKKILPYKETTYDTYNCQRNLNAIIISEKEENIAWFYNAFIQVYSKKDISHGCMTYNFNIDIAHSTQLYDRCPLVESFCIPDEILVLKYNNLAELCIDLIDNNYYIMFTADNYYLFDETIRKEKTYHDATVYGYDNDKKQLLTIEFYGFKAISKWVSFKAINDAYASGKNCFGFVNGIVAVRPTNKFKWQFSLENYKENLKAYLNCTPIVLYYYKYEKDMRYGYSDNKFQYYGVDTYKTFYNLLAEPEKLLSMNYTITPQRKKGALYTKFTKNDIIEEKR